MYGLASSLLCQQHYQDGLYTAEKHLIFLALETLIYEKRKSIGMLRACAPQYYPQYYTENNEENNSDKRCPQNKDTSIEHTRSESSQKKEGTTEKHTNEWITKGKIFRRHSFPNKKTTISNSNMYDILREEEDASRYKYEENQEENEGDFRQLLTQQLNSKDAAQKQIEETLQETYDVEKMHVDALESLVKRLNEEHVSNQMKSTATIKQLKYDIAKKNQDMYIKHKKRKEMEEVYESKYKRLELNLKDAKGRIKTSESKRKELQNAMAEMEAEAELMIDLKEENDNFRFQNSIKEKELKCSKEKYEAEIKRKEKDQINLREKLEIQEAEAKGLEKDVKEWKSKYKAECQSSEELREKLKHSEDLYEFLAPTILK